jgi:hypothetical protein
MKFSFIILLCFYFNSCIGKNTESNHIIINFQPTIGTQLLIIDSVEYEVNGDTLSFETLKFYIGHIIFEKEGNIVWKDSVTYHLLDASNKSSLSLTIKSPPNLSFDKVKFDLGVDSLSNVSGALSGDLDPTKGMYWAWNSGYVNFKLEGNSKICPSRNNAFQFHLGGYMAPFKTVQNIEIKCSNTMGIVNLKMDLMGFLRGIDLSKQYSILSPSKTSVELAQKVSNIFSKNEL